MKIAIISSTEDVAGMNIKKQFIKLYKPKDSGETFDENAVLEFKTDLHECKYFQLNTLHVFSEHIDEKIKEFGFEAEMIIFATSHRSRSGIPSLSVHVQGNWSKAELGGTDRILGVAPARWLRFGLDHLAKLAPTIVSEKFDVMQEVTHHGPDTDTPSMFIELGSDPERHKNEEAATVVAQTIMFMLSNEVLHYKVGLGIGGLHTSPVITRAARKQEYAIGHICPKYMLEHLDLELVKQAIERTVEPVEKIFLDWKGMGHHKEKVNAIIEALESSGIEFEKVK